MSTQPSKLAVDVEFIKPFVSATRSVLETMANTTLSVGKAYVLGASEKIAVDIMGVIDLESPTFRGSISIGFRSEVFLKVYESLVGEKHEQITAEIQDGAAELINMIYGQAKTTLNDKRGYKLSSKLPLIMAGDRIGARVQTKAPAIIIPFESSAGSFFLEIIVVAV